MTTYASSKLAKGFLFVGDPICKFLRFAKSDSLHQIGARCRLNRCDQSEQYLSDSLENNKNAHH